VSTTAPARPAAHPLLLGILGVTLAAFLIVPAPLIDKLHALAAGVCAQRPDHSYFLGGAQLPLEARMQGIFAGFVVGAIFLLWSSRVRAALLPPAAVQGLLLGFVVLMCLDGLNALVYDLGGPALYAPQNALRLATGLLCGLALALLAIPVLAGSLWRDCLHEPSLASAGELVGPVCLLALVQVATMSGVPGLLLPVAILTVVGLIGGFTVGNTYAVLLLSRRERQARGWRDTLNPLLAGVLVSVYELVALAALRYWAEAFLGVHWPV